MVSPTLTSPLSPSCKKLSMEAAQGGTGGYTRAHTPFGNPHDGVASGAHPDKPEVEWVQGEVARGFGPGGYGGEGGIGRDN